MTSQTTRAWDVRFLNSRFRTRRKTILHTQNSVKQRHFGLSKIQKYIGLVCTKINRQSVEKGQEEYFWARKLFGSFEKRTSGVKVM